jgi:predicted DNA binding CopG/RHH family protein
MKKKHFKKIPTFKNEDDKRDFWANHSITDYFDMATAQRAVFPNLKLSTKTISIRLPQGLLDDIKVQANKRDVPYQSLIKILLDEKIRQLQKQ